MGRDGVLLFCSPPWGLAAFGWLVVLRAELLGNLPHATVLLAWVASKRSGGPGQQQQQKQPKQPQQQKQQTAPARSSVGGTLVRHEVTAAHTRSLFCSLQLFFSPLESDSCHSHLSQEFLVRSGATGIAC